MICPIIRASLLSRLDANSSKNKEINEASVCGKDKCQWWNFCNGSMTDGLKEEIRKLNNTIFKLSNSINRK